MKLSVCLMDIDGLPDEREQLNTLARSLSFGQTEIDRLSAKKNLVALKQSLGGLLALKELLAQREIAPMTIVRSKVGKPCFENASFLPFSISHSASLAVAVLEEGNVSLGVDLEFLRPSLAVLELSERFFGESERQAMRDAEDGADAFLWLWTKKEAATKCAGEELARFLGRENRDCFCESYSVLYHGRQAYLTLCATEKIDEVFFLCHAEGLTVEKREKKAAT